MITRSLTTWAIAVDVVERLSEFAAKKKLSEDSVVEEAIKFALDDVEKTEAAKVLGTGKPETAVISAATLLSEARDRKPKSSWGNWIFTDNLCLLWNGWYEIDLEQINTTAKLCDWIFHCWHRDGADLVQAFRDIFEPCANCCSMGVEREFSGSKLASAYAARIKPPVNKSPVPPKIRYEILKRDNFCCQACGAKASADSPLHVDHIVPRKHGGTNDPSNLQVLCATCNLGKGASL